MYQTKNLIRSFHAAILYNQNTLRSLLKLSFHSSISNALVSLGKNIQYAHIQFFNGGRFFVLLFTDGRYSLTQTSVSSRNRTRDSSPGLSNTGRCYLSSPSAIYFWRLMEFRHGGRKREREKENWVAHGRAGMRRAMKREGVNAFRPINALESRFSHFFPIKSPWNSSSTLGSTDVTVPCAHVARCAFPVARN